MNKIVIFISEGNVAEVICKEDIDIRIIDDWVEGLDDNDITALPKELKLSEEGYIYQNPYVVVDPERVDKIFEV